MGCRQVCASSASKHSFTPPPRPLVLPPGGWGGVSLGQHTNFCDGALCCCVGDCVVRHCRWYPLCPWQDILVGFAEMEVDSTPMFTPGTRAVLKGPDFFLLRTAPRDHHVPEQFLFFPLRTSLPGANVMFIRSTGEPVLA